MSSSDWSSDVCSSDLNGIDLRPGRAAGLMSIGIAKPPGPGVVMDALFTSTAVVALADIGDKTQLLAIPLATRFRQPLPITLGILVVTLANHALAAMPSASAAAFTSRQVFPFSIG